MWAAKAICVVAILGAAGGRLYGENTPETTPKSGVNYTQKRVKTGQNVAILHIITVDLTNPKVVVRAVAAGADPDGPGGSWQTTLMTVGKIAEREKFDVAVNGDFFQVKEEKPDANDPAAAFKSAYSVGAWARISGMGMTDGKEWAEGGEPRGALVIDEKGKASVVMASRPPAGAREVMGGIAFGAGIPVYPHLKKEQTRNARTVVGVDEEGGMLTMVVVEGPRQGFSAGMTPEEVQREVLAMGCVRGVQLDGGGSSTLVMREEGGKVRMVNRPTDGKARAVASAVGVARKE